MYHPTHYLQVTRYLVRGAGVDETSSSRDDGTISPSFRVVGQFYVLLSLAEQPLIKQNLLQLAACVLLVPSAEKGGVRFVVSLRYGLDEGWGGALGMAHLLGGAKRKVMPAREEKKLKP